MAETQDIPYATLEQAAEWYATLRAGAVDEDERRRWQDWLAQGAGNRRAWARVEAISQNVAIARQTPDASSAALHAASAQRQRRKLVKTLALAAFTTGLGWQLARTEDVQVAFAGLGASHRIGVGERLDTVLADGTRIWLDSGTVLDQRYDAAQRLVVLHRGEFVLQSGQDARRPLVVRSRQGSMRALGTRFQVRQFDGSTRLGVSEGRVEVTPFDARGPMLVVEAGQEVRFTRSGISTPSALPAGREAWTRGMLIAEDLSLEAFLAELSRYRHGHLGCDPAIAALRVVGAFPAHDTDQALAMLEAALPVRARRVLPWWVTVEAKK
ncbi:FecR domain-containing protein [Telluria beijingensis]|uniref:FecR domain-containing protein n=1 Tax=Telluria beijingensis TaxID=3068633 RepID=UPI002795EDF3|nr:FecR family protein [Massilia sp. REN29]